MNKLKWNR